MRRPTENAAAVDVKDVIAFDVEVDKAARLGIADGTVVDAAVDFFLEVAVHIVHDEVSASKCGADSARVLGRDDVNAAPERRLCRASVGDFEIPDFPILLVFQEYGVLGKSGAVDSRECVATVFVDDDGMVRRTRAPGPELALPRGTCFEVN